MSDDSTLDAPYWCDDCNIPHADCLHSVSLLDTYGAYGGEWLTGQVFRPVEYVVPGLIPEGLSYIIAAPKIGKSWFVLDMAIAAADGGTFLGFRLKARPVLYLALEDGPRRLQSRGHILGVSTFPESITFVNRTKPADALPMMREFMGRNEGRRPLVVLDTLGKIKPGKSPAAGAYEHDYAVSAGLKDVADDNDGSVVVVHHNRKTESADFLEDVSGTQGIAGAADTILVIRRRRTETEGELHVTSRDADEGSYAVDFTEGRWTLSGVDLTTASSALHQRASEKRLDDDSKAMVAVVHDRSRDGLSTTAAEVSERMGWTDADGKKKVRTYLARLADGGHIDRAARGVYEAPTSTVVVSEVSVVNPETGQDASTSERVVSEATVVTPVEPANHATTTTTQPYEDMDLLSELDPQGGEGVRDQDSATIATYAPPSDLPNTADATVKPACETCGNTLPPQSIFSGCPRCAAGEQSA